MAWIMDDAPALLGMASGYGVFGLWIQEIVRIERVLDGMRGLVSINQGGAGLSGHWWGFRHGMVGEGNMD